MTVTYHAQFPGYEILGELGRSNARVLKARHLFSGELVAIKHFHQHTDAETLRRFEQESTMMLAIHHPNVVLIREVNLKATFPFVVMELIEGGDLRKLLKLRGQLELTTVIRLGLQMTAALAELAAHSITHRDIKPENILYRHLPSGELHFLLADFGVAQLRQHHQTLTGQSLLTYEYASPEQFDNPRGVTAASDYYGIGVVLFEAIAGRVPFPLDQAVGMMPFIQQLMHEPPPLSLLTNSCCPPSLTRAIEALLQKSAANRLSTPTVLTRHLKMAELELLQDSDEALPLSLPVGASPPPQPIQAGPKNSLSSTSLTKNLAQPTRKPVTEAVPNPQRRSYPVWLIVLAGVGLLAIAVYWTSFRSAVANPSVQPISVATDVVRQHQEAEATRQQEQAKRRRDQLIAAAKQVTVTIPEHHADKLFGGISGVRVQLSNPTELTFNWVQAEVRYYLASGELYKTEDVFFHNVASYTMPIQGAPDSPRGTSIDVKITKADSPELNQLKIIDQ